MLRLKGINELPKEEDGFRILIDEFWPKGLSKEEAKVDLWIKEIKPTKDLDEWPENLPKCFEEVEAKYRDEIHKKTLIKFIRDTEKEKGTVTFLCSTIKSIMQLQF
jgi:uncharacterized protein YeaO (DUF488 family)